MSIVSLTRVRGLRAAGDDVSPSQLSPGLILWRRTHSIRTALEARSYFEALLLRHVIFLGDFLLGCRNLRLIIADAAQSARSAEHCGMPASCTVGQPLTMNARQHISLRRRIESGGSSKASRVFDMEVAGYREAWSLLGDLWCRTFDGSGLSPQVKK